MIKFKQSKDGIFISIIDYLGNLKTFFIGSLIFSVVFTCSTDMVESENSWEHIDLDGNISMKSGKKKNIGDLNFIKFTTDLGKIILDPHTGEHRAL